MDRRAPESCCDGFTSPSIINILSSTWCHFFFLTALCNSLLFCRASLALKGRALCPMSVLHKVPQLATGVVPASSRRCSSVGGLPVESYHFYQLLFPLFVTIAWVSPFYVVCRFKANLDSPLNVPQSLSKPTRDFVVFLSFCLLFPSFFLPSLPWRLLTGMKHRAVGRCWNLSVAVRQVFPQC